jgi:hypothetical protein
LMPPGIPIHKKPPRNITYIAVRYMEVKGSGRKGHIRRRRIWRDIFTVDYNHNILRRWVQVVK